MSLYLQISDSEFTRDMSIYNTVISTSQKSDAMDAAEGTVIERLTGHGYEMPATTVVVSTIVGTGTSLSMEKLIRRTSELDLLSGSGTVPPSLENWQNDVKMLWGDVKAHAFITSNYFTEDLSTTRQRGRVQSLRIKRG